VKKIAHLRESNRRKLLRLASRILKLVGENSMGYPSREIVKLCKKAMK
jgi:hypothetical protein